MSLQDPKIKSKLMISIDYSNNLVCQAINFGKSGYSLTKKNAGFLARDNFYIALRLIALVQNDHPISDDSLNTFQDVPLPDFKRQAAQQQSAPQQKNISDEELNTQWAMAPEEKNKYLAYFKKVDTDNDGFINGKEIATIFQSRLDIKTLQIVCKLSDVDQDQRFSADEFAIAMHLSIGIVNKKITHSSPSSTHS